MTQTERLEALAAALTTASAALAEAHEQLSELRIADRDTRALDEMFGPR